MRRSGSMLTIAPVTQTGRKLKKERKNRAKKFRGTFRLIMFDAKRADVFRDNQELPRSRRVPRARRSKRSLLFCVCLCFSGDRRDTTCARPVSAVCCRLVQLERHILPNSSPCELSGACERPARLWCRSHCDWACWRERCGVAHRGGDGAAVADRASGPRHTMLRGATFCAGAGRSRFRHVDHAHSARSARRAV